MLSPERRNSENVNKKEKSRHVLVYMSVFFFLIFAFVLLSSFKPSLNLKRVIPPDSEDTIFVYDTVYYYDTTFVFDTVYLSEYYLDTTKIRVKKLKNKGLFKKESDFLLKNDNNLISSGKHLFSFDLSFSPMYSSHSFQSDFIYKEVSDINKKSVQEDFSSSIGLGMNFHRPYVTYSSGLNFTQYRENFNFLATDFLIDTILAYRFFTTTEIIIDTIEFYNIDSLLIGDTVIEYYYDSTRITSLDSNLVLKPDTVEYQLNDKSSNTYSYLEIPLIFSFNIYRTNFYISPQVGIITSFFIDSKGKIVSLANLNQSNSIKEESKFAAINLSVYAGLKFNYFLNRRVDFFTSAFFRKNINSIYRNYPIVSRFNTFGFTFGLRYKIAF